MFYTHNSNSLICYFLISCVYARVIAAYELKCAEELRAREYEEVVAETEALVELRAHWEANKSKSLRKEWDLNDPESLKKDLPARIGK